MRLLHAQIRDEGETNSRCWSYPQPAATIRNNAEDRRKDAGLIKDLRLIGE